MVVVPHEAPSKNRPTVEIADLSKRLDELDCLAIVVEDELTAGDATVDVVDGSRDEQARVSRRRNPPMRGRDQPILYGPDLRAMVHSERGTLVA